MTELSRSYPVNAYDRYIDGKAPSTLRKMQQQYYVTKQVVLQKLGRKEDEYIVASDADLDAKLELYRSIEHTSFKMQKVIEMYQDKIIALSQEENCMGRFLKEQGKVDKTRAGKMMMAAGKSLSFTAQQRLALRVPLVRLHQEVDTFRSRAISDTLINVTQMETARTEYRGALLWMKDISQELDPDTYKQLDKFRKVQNQVRRSKAHFDKLKVDCLQKIDLLAASRCNMFSHALAVYQNTLLAFWKKTSKTMTAVSDSFKGYQHYEFCMLKELTEPSKKLAEETSQHQPPNAQQLADEGDSDRLIFFEEYHDNNEDDKSDSKSKENSNPKEKVKKPILKSKDKQQDDALLDLDFSDVQSESEKDSVQMSKTEKNSTGHIDLLTNQLDIDDQDKDDLMLLNEILSMPTEASLNEEPNSDWQASFGFNQDSTPFTVNWKTAFADDISQKPNDDSAQDFLPSQLLDLNIGLDMLQMQLPKSPVTLNSETPTTQTTNMPVPDKKLSPAQKPKSASSKQDKAKDKSAWFNLFADLDPLSNPDAVGKKAGDASEQDRNC